MHSPQAVEVANKSLSFRSIPIHDATPTGTQLALAAGYTHNQSVLVFQIVESGLLEDIRPEESADLSRGRKFIIEEGDRAYRLKINSLTFDWPARQISREQVRFLGNIAAEDEVLLTRIDQPDKVIGDHEQVDLGKPETEAFISRKASWKLNVQGVVREYQVPVVTVRDAMVNAGFDPDAGWIIHLKVQGQPNQKVTLDYPVDLRTPGVEKIRLTARDVDNGEAPSAPHRDFALLPADIEHLDSLGLHWEALVEGQQRWLIVQDFPLPSGYTLAKVTIALLIPPTYPAAQIDMFFVYPEARLECGRAIPNTESRALIGGREFVRWSRHRSGTSTWNPSRDNVKTQLALADGALHKEVGE